MVLPVDQLPLPFTYRALSAGEFNLHLNPPNYTIQGRPLYIRFLGKTVRGFARLIYQIGVTVFCAPLGVLYHTGAALTYKAKSWTLRPNSVEQTVANEIAFEHLVSVIADLLGIITISGAKFWYRPRRSVSFFAPASLIQVTAEGDSVQFSTRRMVPVEYWEHGTHHFFQPIHHMPNEDARLPTWGWYAYGLAAHRRLPNYSLAVASSHLWEQGIFRFEGGAWVRRHPTGQELKLGSRETISRVISGLAVHATTVGYYPISSTPLDCERLEIAELLSPGQLENGPRYPIPWKSIAYTIAAVALLALVVANFYIFPVILSVLLANVPLFSMVLMAPAVALYPLCTPFMALFMFYKAKEAYTTQYNDADRAFAKEILFKERELKEECLGLISSVAVDSGLNKVMPVEKALIAATSFLKARDRGDSIAQHVYGQALLKRASQAIGEIEAEHDKERAVLLEKVKVVRGQVKKNIRNAIGQLYTHEQALLTIWNKRANEGLEWLSISAQGGNVDALEDLSVLFKSTQEFLLARGDDCRYTKVRFFGKFRNPDFRKKIEELRVNQTMREWPDEAADFMRTALAIYDDQQAQKLDQAIEDATQLHSDVSSMITDYLVLKRKNSVHDRNKRIENWNTVIDRETHLGLAISSIITEYLN